VQGAPAEAVVGRAIVGAVARHCSAGGGGEWIGEKRWNAAGQARGSPRYIGGRALTRLATWLHVHRRQAFIARERRCARKTTMRGRRCDEDDDRPLSPISQGHTTRRKFSRRFARISFVRSPQAPRKAGMSWARLMDEGPNLDENEEPGARLDHFSPFGWKKWCRRPHRARGWRCSNR
jgi:hypothetical protein